MSSFWSRFSAEDKARYFEGIGRYKAYLSQYIASHDLQEEILSTLTAVSQLIDSILEVEGITVAHVESADAYYETLRAASFEDPQIFSVLKHTALLGTEGSLSGTYQPDISLLIRAMMWPLENYEDSQRRHAALRQQIQQERARVREIIDSNAYQLERVLETMQTAINSGSMQAEQDFKSMMNTLSICALSASLLGVVLLIVGLVLANAIVAGVGLGMAVAGGISFFALGSEGDLFEAASNTNTASLT